MDSSIIISIVVALVAMILSLTVHEWAHAYAAHKLGDDTAKNEGRLTLSPDVHIDPIGSLLVPTIGVLMGGFVFGWAKPVPFRAFNFTRKVTMRQGTAIVAVAGPLSNLVIAFVCALLLKVIVLAGGPTVWAEVAVLKAIGMLLAYGVMLNIILFLFNLLPIPPLDGHAIASSFLGPSHPYIQFVERYWMFMLIMVFMLGGRFLSGPMVGLSSGILNLFGVTRDASILLNW